VETESWNTAFWLGSFIAISMFVWVPIRTGKSLPAVAVGDGWPIVFSGLLQTASSAFFIFAINLTAVANAMVIIAAAPVVAALIAHFAIGEKTSTRTWIGIAGSIVGIVVVMSGSFGQGRIEGDLFALAAICAFGTNLTIWRRIPDLNRQVAIGLGGLGLALISVIPADPGALDTRAMVILAILGLVTGPTGRVSLATSTRYLPVSQVSLFASVETIAAIVWAWLFLDETPPMTALVGGIIVIASLIYGVARLRGDAEAIPVSP
jgi:drug/metabolite transporter (DMT)-like permease